MVKCKICDIKKEISIVEHLRHTHKLTVSAYRELYGSDSEVKSEKAKSLISEQQKRVWQDPDYAAKMCSSRQITHRTERFRKNQSDRIKKVYEAGFHTWNEGLTKESDERLASIGAKNREHLTGRTKDTHEYLLESSESRKDRVCFGGGPSKWSEEKREIWKEKISKSIAEGISSGKYGSSQGAYKKGWYARSDGTQEYFDSSWELELMQYLESKQGIIYDWTKNHRIRIEYDAGDVTRRYVPDFLITYGPKKLILEIKGYVRSESELLSKKKSAEIWAAKNNATYLLCRSTQEAIAELEKFYESGKD